MAERRSLHPIGIANIFASRFCTARMISCNTQDFPENSTANRLQPSPCPRTFFETVQREGQLRAGSGLGRTLSLQNGRKAC